MLFVEFFLPPNAKSENRNKSFRFHFVCIQNSKLFLDVSKKKDDIEVNLFDDFFNENCRRNWRRHRLTKVWTGIESEQKETKRKGTRKIWTQLRDRFVHRGNFVVNDSIVWRWWQLISNTNFNSSTSENFYFFSFEFAIFRQRNYCLACTNSTDNSFRFSSVLFCVFCLLRIRKRRNFSAMTKTRLNWTCFMSFSVYVRFSRVCVRAIDELAICLNNSVTFKTLTTHENETNEFAQIKMIVFLFASKILPLCACVCAFVSGLSLALHFGAEHWKTKSMCSHLYLLF